MTKEILLSHDHLPWFFEGRAHWCHCDPQRHPPPVFPPAWGGVGAGENIWQLWRWAGVGGNCWALCPLTEVSAFSCQLLSRWSPALTELLGELILSEILLAPLVEENFLNALLSLSQCTIAISDSGHPKPTTSASRTRVPLLPAPSCFTAGPLFIFFFNFEIPLFLPHYINILKNFAFIIWLTSSVTTGTSRVQA